MDIKGRKNINKAVLMWAAAALLLLIMATPALSTIFAAPGSVNTKALVNGAVKTKKIAAGAVKSGKIAAGAVNSAKIADGSIVNADIAAGAAIAASKINRTGLDADLLDGKDSGDFVAKTGDQAMAGKLTASSFGYSGPKTSYLSINASAFTPADSAYENDGLNAGWILPAGPAVTQFWVAPVHLPHGATVKSVRFRAWDNDGARNYSGQMSRLSSVGGDTVPVAQRDTVGLASVSSWRLLEDSIIDYAQIDNQSYDYAIFVTLYGGANVMAGQVMITYETSGP